MDKTVNAQQYFVIKSVCNGPGKKVNHSVSQINKALETLMDSKMVENLD